MADVPEPCCCVGPFDTLDARSLRLCSPLVREGSDHRLDRRRGGRRTGGLAGPEVEELIQGLGPKVIAPLERGHCATVLGRAPPKSTSDWPSATPGDRWSHLVPAATRAIETR